MRNNLSVQSCGMNAGARWWGEAKSSQKLRGVKSQTKANRCKNMRLRSRLVPKPKWYLILWKCKLLLRYATKCTNCWNFWLFIYWLIFHDLYIHFIIYFFPILFLSFESSAPLAKVRKAFTWGLLMPVLWKRSSRALFLLIVRLGEFHGCLVSTINEVCSCIASLAAHLGSLLPHMVWGMLLGAVHWPLTQGLLMKASSSYILLRFKWLHPQHVHLK